jgi:hypothetical protein
MSQLTIQHRAAAVRKSWNYGEKLQRVVAAQVRCQRLLQQLGLAPETQFAYAHNTSRGRSSRLSG